MGIKLGKYEYVKKYTDKDGNVKREKVNYKTFATYDAYVFFDTFDSVLKENHRSRDALKLNEQTIKLLDLMQEIKQAMETFFDARLNWRGKVCADGDKTLYVLSALCNTYVKFALKNIRAEKEFALTLFNYAETKKEQDKALESFMDKMIEEQAVADAVDRSITTNIFLSYDDRKEIVDEYLNNVKKTRKKIMIDDDELIR